jgi:hypothetical protein
MSTAQKAEKTLICDNAGNGRFPAGCREKTLTRFPAGSRKIIDRVPQGWVVGGSTQSTPSAATRGYSASTSSTRRSRMTSSGRGPLHSGPWSAYSVNRRRENPTEAGPAWIST